MKRNKFLKYGLNIIALTSVLFLISWVLASNKKHNEEKTALAALTNDKVSVKAQNVVMKNLNLDFNTNGNFQPWREMDFASENAGRVTRILVKEGSRVVPGQTLALIDAGIINIDLESAEAALQNALRDQERYENAYKTGGVTQQQLDQIRLSVKNAKARVGQAKIRSTDANVRSSIGGVVNKKYVEPGAYVSAGTKMFELVDVSRLKLIVNVNENQVTQIKTGDKVQVTASVYPDKTYAGKISFIGNKADAALNFPVEIEIENKGNDLKAGMYGTANFKFENKKSFVVVPRNAFAGSVSTNEVYVVKDGIAKLRKVTSGRVIGQEVEILNGLEEGEQVVTSGQINLQDGSKITAIQ